MPRRPKQSSPEQLRQKIIDLLQSFESELRSGELRSKVLSLIPIQRSLRDLGCSLVVDENVSAARDRILHYLLKYPGIVIRGEELSIVAGISEWARRVRELRVQFGWRIVTGVSVKDMTREGEDFGDCQEVADMKPDDYLLLEEEPDQDVAARWHMAHEIRNRKGSIREKILAFLRANVGKEIMGEELRYVANDKTEWARRVRELRTEYGWPVVTQNTGRPSLPVGVYVLERDRQSPEHDRHIPDPVRRAVLVRDGYACTVCGWNHEMWNRADPRNLELHHVKPHAQGGSNDPDNLATVCNICHDEIHRKTPR